MAADLDLVRRLAGADHGLAIISTTRTDGTVHSSLINAGIMDDPLGDGSAVAGVIRGGAAKLGHFRRTGQATITFRAGWEWASVDGPVTVIGPDDPHPDYPQLLRDIFTAAGGTHDDWAEYDRVMADEGRVAIFIGTKRILGSGR
ncbi:MAG TPA: pyridoxamine 5'-phosphate oxidase [Pseudonocardiaceae bacterium]|nr:pyridoxamine 5'-phosphate oxidase [Pseudonocardiaceae bacterium]